MIHCFKVNGEYFIYDVESSALMETEKIVYDILNSASLENYSDDDVREAREELDSLAKQGVINAAAPEGIVPEEKSREIKALCMHMSHDCNLRCKYCFADEGAYHGRRMNMPCEVAFSAIDFLVANSGNRYNLEVDFFGGEPLMNFSVLKETVEYAKSAGAENGKKFKFTTTTNGLLLDADTADYLNREMDNVVLSMDGRKEVNDLQRPTANGKGSFDLIIDKFRYFRSIRGDGSYFIRGTFTANNPDFCDDVLYMADCGFDQVSAEPAVLPDGHPLALTEEMLPAVCGSYEKLVCEYVKRRRKDDSWFSFFHFNVDLENGPCYKKRLVGCGAGSEYVAVTPDGNIYPCHQFAGEKDFLLGNVFDKVLDEDKRDYFRRSNLYTKSDCANCWAKYHCSGGCAANAVHFNKNIDKPYAAACVLMRKRLECALYAYAKEHKNN